MSAAVPLVLLQDPSADQPPADMKLEEAEP